MPSVVSVTEEINKQVVSQAPNVASIVALIHAAETTGLSGSEKLAGVVQVATNALATPGVPAQVQAIANTVNLFVQLFNALGVFKKKSAAATA